MAEFDAYAHNYAEVLAQGLALSGENSSFYLQRRAAWLRDCLNELNVRPDSCLDFGCGCGDSAPELLTTLGLSTLTGVDASASQIKVARARHAALKASFWNVDEFAPAGTFDLAYTNGVFHHIETKERVRWVQYINACLKPGAYFALWENNPWNPGTRYVMSRIPFDRTAIPLPFPEARSVVKDCGFRIIHTTFLFLFPRVLALFRRLEPLVARLPLGGQYQILSVKI
jgi:predicted TPR repeat methyltransferase